MGLGFDSWSLIPLLLVVVGGQVNGAMEMGKENERKLTDRNHDMFKMTNALRLHSMDNDDPTVHGELHHLQHDHELHTEIHRDTEHGHSHMDHLDASLIVFFLVKDLTVGKVMPIYFPKRDPSSSPRLLPREEADGIPFSYKELNSLLGLFSFSEGSQQANAMEYTLRQCEIKPIKGETKYCATSLESMLDFASSVFGLETQIQILSTTHLTKSSTLFQNYTILEVPQEFSAPKMVACHTMPYPYAVFYCHSQESKSRVFKVSLEGENGDRVEALAVCHMDTSAWSPNHVSFRVLGIQPGTSPICHFFPADNFVWIPSAVLI